MRIRHALLSSAVSISLSIGLAPPANAQSFFQKLFGFGSSSPMPSAVRPPAQTIPAQRFYNRLRRLPQSRIDEEAEEDIGPPDSGGPYRTMCVRACDGYYFPVRHNAWRRNFAPDAKSCRNACGGEGRLFYYSLNGGSVDAMVDLAGRAYKDLPHAYGYRKALVSGCTCKPVPWSYEEAARHRRYEEEEAATLRQAGLQTSSAEEDVKDGEVGAAANDPQDASQAKGEGQPTVPAPGHAAAAPTAAEDDQKPVPPTQEPVIAQEAVPVREVPMAQPLRRRKARVLNTPLRKAAYKEGFGFTLFSPQKSKFVWPGDRR